MCTTHAIFEQANDDFLLRAAEPKCCDTIFINGKKAKESNKLNHLDRIIFGMNTTYVFKDPSNASPDDIEITYDYIMKEKIDIEKESMNLEVQEEAPGPIPNDNIEDEKENNENEKENNENESKIIKKPKPSKNKGTTIPARKKLTPEEAILEDNLTKYLPMIKEANLIAEELKRDVKLELKLVKELPDWIGKNIGNDLKKAKTAVQIRVENLEEGTQYKWDGNNFEEIGRAHV